MQDENVEGKTCFTLGDYVVDAGDHTLKKEGKTRQVEPRAMQVLIVLANHAGDTVSRHTLLKQVWGDRVVVEEALTRTISQLRAALDDSKTREVIQTVPKKGYRLKADVVWLDKKSSPSKPLPSISSNKEPASSAEFALRSEPPIADFANESEHSEPAARPETIKGARASRKRWWSVFLVGVLVIAVFFTVNYRSLHQNDAEDSKISIAVLPLQQLSDDQQALYLAEGLPDELLSAIAKVPEFSVASRYSTFAHAAEDKDPKVLAQLLHVQYLLSGRVRKTENGFKITVNLIDASEDRTLWAETYESSAAQLSGIQEDIAANVIGELLPTSGRALDEVGDVSIENVEAYQYYLQGVYWLMNGKTSEWFYRAEHAFSRAIDVAPDYAAAYGSLAYLYARYDYHDNYMPAEIAIPLAQKTIQKALALNPDELNAHLASAILATSRQNFSAAEASLDKVFSLYPDNATALYLYSELALSRNDFDQALEYAKKALDTDPLSPWINVNLAMVHYWRGEFTEALAAAETAIRIDNSYTWAYVWQAKIYHQLDQRQQAIEAMESCVAIDASSPVNNAYLGLLYWQEGEKEQAQRWFSSTASLYGDTPDARFWQAFERFAIAQQDADVGVQLMTQLSLLDNHIFSLVPRLTSLYKTRGWQKQGVAFFEKRLTRYAGEPITVNYRNRHLAHATLALRDNRDRKDDLQQAFRDFQSKLAAPLRLARE